MGNIIKKLFSAFRTSEKEPELKKLVLDTMATLDKKRIKAIIKQWLVIVEAQDSVPEDIVAINFNVWEAAEETGASCYTLELTGSRLYDPNDDDWACREDFEPRERNCDSLQLCSKLPWEDVLNTLVEIISELKDELRDMKIFRVEHITVGFTDGGLVVVK